MTVKSDNSLNDRVTKLEFEVKSIKDDLEDIESIKKTNIEQSAQFKYIVKSLDEIKETVDELKSKPNKYWDTVITVVLTAVITGCFTHFILH